ncbi:MAG: hypothetical protein AAF500_10445 [Myxococcota bacterium]
MIDRLASLSPALLRVLTIRFGMLFAFCTALMALLGVPLEGELTPWGIVSFQLARTPMRALAILLQWQADSALGHAKLGLLVDFLYLVVYSGFFVTLALWLGALLRDGTWSVRAAWAAVGAAVCDALENVVLLIEVVRVDSPSPYPEAAFSFAVIKFALLGGAIAYVVSAIVRLLARR